MGLEAELWHLVSAAAVGAAGVGPVVAAPVAAVLAMAQAGAAAPVAALAVAVPNGGPGARDLSGRGLHRMLDGSELFCMCINESRRQGFNNRPAQCDGRILGRRLQHLGASGEASVGDGSRLH